MMNSRFVPLTLGALLAILSGCHQQAGAPEKEKEAVEKNNSVLTDSTSIKAAIAKASGIEVAAAGPGAIRNERTVQGLLMPIEGRVARVVARFPGPVRSVRANVGDTVRVNQPLAVIESNISLSDYTVSAPLAGTVVSRHVEVGDLAADMPLFEIVDLSRLWVDMHVFGADAQQLHAGLPVSVTRLSDGISVTTTIDRLLPGTATSSQSTVVRAVIINTNGDWRPGTVVEVHISVSAETAALVVPLSAIQTLRDQTVVFVQHGETYQAKPVTLGRRDSHSVEVETGLTVGEPVVVTESYLIKADIEKASVEDSD